MYYAVGKRLNCTYIQRFQDRRAAEKIEPDKRAWTFEQVSKIAAPKNGRTFEIAYAKIA